MEPSSPLSVLKDGWHTKNQQLSFCLVCPLPLPSLSGRNLTFAFLGRLSQSEYAGTVHPILDDGTGDKEHFHNQLLAAVYGNVTREMPDQGPAPWVSANDKPAASSNSKPVSGDAAERRLKGDVMQLPARDRRRIKDLVHNDVRYCL